MRRNIIGKFPLIAGFLVLHQDRHFLSHMGKYQVYHSLLGADLLLRSSKDLETHLQASDDLRLLAEVCPSSIYPSIGVLSTHHPDLEGGNTGVGEWHQCCVRCDPPVSAAI